jgi:serine/threonine-protein kinase
MCYNRLLLNGDNMNDNTSFPQPVPGEQATSRYAGNPGTPPTEGRMTILKRLGSGGFGNVYKVRIGEDTLALKICEGRSKEGQFQAGLTTHRDLKHPQIPEYRGFGRTEEGRLYYLMDHVNGRPLTRVGLPTEEKVAAVCQAMRPVEYLHGRKLIHRDLKPDNMIFDPETGTTHLIDFDITVPSGFSERYFIFGTPAYLAPEVWEGEAPAAPTTDVYSLGATLYHAATGTVPFEGSVTTIRRQHVHTKPTHPSKVSTDVNTSLGNVILKAMAKRPAKRFSTVSELRHETTATLKPAQKSWMGKTLSNLLSAFGYEH